MKIYTRGGDAGQTSLVGGRRINKSSERLDAYGTIDELNSFIGWLRATPATDIRTSDALSELRIVQNRLFNLGAYLATDPADLKEGPDTPPAGLDDEDTLRLEQEIDRMDTELPPLRAFILPGGCEGACRANIARTICRRAERRIASLEGIHPVAMRFVNRLSDYLFALGRYLNHLEGRPDVEWEK